jgi:hypothetical protein
MTYLPRPWHFHHPFFCSSKKVYNSAGSKTENRRRTKHYYKLQII